MNCKLSKLKNGLRVLVVPMPGLESATLTVWVKVGSRDEKDEILGISHFLEHMVFKGSKKRPSAREISQVVDGIGGEFNAATGKEWTNFYIKARAGSLETAFDILSDMVLNPVLSEEEIEREKGVILEEKKMSDDNPMMDIPDLFENLVFKGEALGRDIIGTEKSIKNIKKEDFKNHKMMHYFADNLLLTVSGGVKEAEVMKLAESYFGKLNNGKQTPLRQGFAGQAKPQVLLKTKKDAQVNMILGFRGYPLGHKNRFAEAVLASILGMGMSSRLFIEIRERRGLAYSVRTSPEHYIDTGYFATYVGVDPNKCEEAITVMLAQHYGITNGQLPIFNKELKKAKEFLKGHLALSLEDTKSVNYFFGERQLLLDRIETPEDIYGGIDKVTIKDIVNVAKELFKKENLNLALIGPYTDASKFEKLLN
ncbi:MAG: pitrilysin family protein [Patescibacteria group bacterium]